MTSLNTINVNGNEYTLGGSSSSDNIFETVEENYHGVALQSNGVSWGLVCVMVKVSAGDRIKTNFNPLTQSIAVPYAGCACVLDLPYSDKEIWLASEYTELQNKVVYGFAERPSDNIYEVPSNLGTDLSMLFYIKYGGWNGVALVEYPTATYKRSFEFEGKQSISAWYHDTQDINYICPEETNKTLFYSLYQAVSPLVNAHMLVLGDSITETVAKETVANNIQGNRPYYGNGFITNIVRKYNMTCDITGVSSSRWFPTTGKNSCVDMVKAVCFPEGAAPSADKYDYIIIEFGTNDILFRPNGYGTLSDVASDELNCSTVSAIRYCIETLQDTFPFAKILIVMPFLRDPSDQANQNAYIELADSVFDEYGIKRVYPRTQAGITSALMCSDGIHLHVKSDADDPTMLAEGVKRLSECIEGGLLTM